MNSLNASRQIRESMDRGTASIVDEHLKLGREDLIQACRDAQAGCERSKERVFHATSRWAMKIAGDHWNVWHRMLPNAAQYDDVLSSAFEGLVRALETYDPDSGNTFTTYAHPWIMTKVQRCIYQMIGTVRIPEKRILQGIDEYENMMSKHTYQIVHRGDNQDVVSLRPWEVNANVMFSCDDESYLPDLQKSVADVEDGAEILRLLDQGFEVQEVALQLGIPAHHMRQRMIQIREALEDVRADYFSPA